MICVVICIGTILFVLKKQETNVISEINDLCIYTHKEDKFCYMIFVPDETHKFYAQNQNEILIEIYWYKSFGFIDNILFNKNHYFDDTEHAYKSELVVTDIPDHYGFAEKVVHVDSLKKNDMTAYGFNDDEYEYSLYGREIIKPFLITMNDESQYIIYKMYNKLYMRKISQ